MLGIKTCKALRAEPHRLAHVVHARLEAALLEPPLCTIPFNACYFDGCSGLTAPLVDMIRALFHPSRKYINPPLVALGFTLTRAEPGGKSLGNRELEVSRALASACAASGFTAPVHVLDDPGKWDIPDSIVKEHDDTLTFWYVVTQG